MHFTKMQGIGNDYVYVNGATDRPRDPAAAARFVSDRHFGIGSDGLILINPSQKADFEMEMYNADGSRGEMCGNGIRCVGKYVYDHGLTDRTTLRIETLAGIRTLELTVGGDGKVWGARVDMGRPVLEPKKIPVALPAETRDEAAGCRGTVSDGGISGAVVSCPHRFGSPDFPGNFLTGGEECRITCVSMGNPHCVIFTDRDVDALDLAAIGPVFENADIFPERINTEFVNVKDRGRLRMRVWERGSGETLACGTGACASAVAAVLNGLADRRVTVELAGGELTIEWSEADGHVYMTGPAAEVFEGTIEEPESERERQCTSYMQK